MSRAGLAAVEDLLFVTRQRIPYFREKGTRDARVEGVGVGWENGNVGLRCQPHSMSDRLVDSETGYETGQEQGMGARVGSGRATMMPASLPPATSSYLMAPVNADGDTKDTNPTCDIGKEKNRHSLGLCHAVVRGGAAVAERAALSSSHGISSSGSGFDGGRAADASTWGWGSRSSGVDNNAWGQGQREGRVRGTKDVVTGNSQDEQRGEAWHRTMEIRKILGR